MRVVIVRSNPINPDSRVERLVKALNDAGYSVSILCWDRGCYSVPTIKADIINGASVKIIKIGVKSGYGRGYKGFFSFLAFQAVLLLWLFRNIKNYDVVHGCDFDASLVPFILSKIFRKKFIFDIFDFLYSKNDTIRNPIKKSIVWLQQSIASKADAVIVCTEERVDQIGIDSIKKITVVHNTPEKINNEIVGFDKINNLISISYVGILQDYRLLLEQVDFFKKNQTFVWHVAGFGKYEKLLKVASEESKNIVYYGKVSHDAALRLMARCDIMSAIYDPSIENHIYAAPNKFYEALMLGKPLIMIKGTGMADYVELEDVGVLADDYSTASFDIAINKLADRKEEWNDMKERMIKLYDQEFSWEVMNYRIVNLYKDITNE